MEVRQTCQLSLRMMRQTLRMDGGARGRLPGYVNETTGARLLCPTLATGACREGAAFAPDAGCRRTPGSRRLRARGWAAGCWLLVPGARRAGAASARVAPVRRVEQGWLVRVPTWYERRRRRLGPAERSERIGILGLGEGFYWAPTGRRASASFGPNFWRAQFQNAEIFGRQEQNTGPHR
jgi:hypothetical protein